MTLKYVRDTYEVPAWRGRVVLYRQERWRIISAGNGRLWLRHTAQPSRRISVHPLDNELFYLKPVTK